MKKRIGLLVACIFSVILCLNVIVGCSDAPKEKPQITVSSSAPVRIDRKTESVDVFDGVTAVDMYGKDITDRITVSCREGGMSVNGAKATFAECGDFTLVYSVSDDNGEKATAEKTVSVRDFYSVYLTNATVPALYGALDMASNEYPFLFYNERATDGRPTVDVNVYEERAVDTYGITEDDYNTLVDKFLELYAEDSYRYFRIFVSDACNQRMLRAVFANDIAEERYEVKYVSEGTKSYDVAFPYYDNDTYETWQRNVDIYEHMVELAKNKQELSYDGVTLVKYDGDELGASYLYAASKPNAEFWGAYPEVLVSKDPRVQAEIEKAHLLKRQPPVMYNALTDAQKGKFLESVGFDKKDFDTKFFGKSGDYLIITGSKDVMDTLTTEQSLSVLTKIYEDYAGCNILFKPHPQYIPNESEYPEIYNFMKSHNIDILPGTLPIEVITWVYGNARIGGFDGSLFMSVPQGNTVFFIAEGKDALSAVSQKLYESGLFGEVAFYWPQAEEESE